MATSYRKSKFSETALIALSEELMPILERLPSGMTLIAENLFDHADWQSMSPTNRRKTGEMIAALVTYEMLPLTFLHTGLPVQRYLKTDS